MEILLQDVDGVIQSGGFTLVRPNAFLYNANEIGTFCKRTFKGNIVKTLLLPSFEITPMSMFGSLHLHAKVRTRDGDGRSSMPVVHLELVLKDFTPRSAASVSSLATRITTHLLAKLFPQLIQCELPCLVGCGTDILYNISSYLNVTDAGHLLESNKSLSVLASTSHIFWDNIYDIYYNKLPASQRTLDTPERSRSGEGAPLLRTLAQVKRNEREREAERVRVEKEMRRRYDEAAVAGRTGGNIIFPDDDDDLMLPFPGRPRIPFPAPDIPRLPFWHY